MSMNRRQMRREIVAQRQQIFDLAEELQSRKKWSASSEERHFQELRESTVEDWQLYRKWLRESEERIQVLQSRCEELERKQHVTVVNVIGPT